MESGEQHQTRYLTCRLSDCLSGARMPNRSRYHVITSHDQFSLEGCVGRGILTVAVRVGGVNSGDDKDDRGNAEVESFARA